MSEIFYIDNGEPGLDWTYWTIKPPDPDTKLKLPETHTQTVAPNPEAAVADFYSQRALVREVCGPVLQFSARVALRECDREQFCARAAAQGVDVRLGPANIPGADGLIRLGYLQLLGLRSFVYPPDSVIESGLKDGHCLLVRTGAIMSPALSVGARALAQERKLPLDVVHRYRSSTPHKLWTVGARDRLE